MSIITQNGPSPFDPYWTDEVPPPRRFWRGQAALGLAAAASLIGAAVFLSEPRREPSSPDSVAAAPVLTEALAPDLPPLLNLDAGESRMQYEARVVAATGDRRDRYSFGSLGGDSTSLRLEMWRRAQGAPAAGLFVEIAELAAAYGAVVERLEVPHRLAASQGPVEWAELTLAGVSRSCVGFRLAGAPAIGLRGVACAAPGGKMDAAALSCLIDRLALTEAGRQTGFGALLKAGGARRPACRAVVG